MLGSFRLGWHSQKVLSLKKFMSKKGGAKSWGMGIGRPLAVGYE